MGGNRDLLRGSLDLMVLSALADGPLYGYLIQKRIGEVSAGQAEIQAGTLYPVLYRLQKAGHIKSSWEGDGGRERRWYELTEAGRELLNRRTREWHNYAGWVARMLRPQGPADGGMSPAGESGL